MFFITIHIVSLSSCFVFPVVIVLLKLDPLYHILVIFLPPADEWSLYLVVPIILLRIFVLAVYAYEYSRFFILHIFVFASIIFTTSTCLRKVIRNFMMPETITLKSYIRLCIVMKASDYFIRHANAHLMVFYQIFIISMYWLVIKCWNILPIYITLAFCMIAVGTSVASVLIIPCTVEICTASEKFLIYKKARNHTFNRNSRKYFNFLKWSSQQMLIVRFGDQFIFNERTLINYLNVSM